MVDSGSKYSNAVKNYDKLLERGEIFVWNIFWSKTVVALQLASI